MKFKLIIMLAGFLIATSSMATALKCPDAVMLKMDFGLDAKFTQKTGPNIYQVKSYFKNVSPGSLTFYRYIVQITNAASAADAMQQANKLPLSSTPVHYSDHGISYCSYYNNQHISSNDTYAIFKKEF